MSQSWAVIDESTKVSEVKLEDPNKFNDEQTLLYNQDTRQSLQNDLEECEYFLRSRLQELQSKDQTTFAMYLEG